MATGLIYYPIIFHIVEVVSPCRHSLRTNENLSPTLPPPKENVYETQFCLFNYSPAHMVSPVGIAIDCQPDFPAQQTWIFSKTILVEHAMMYYSRASCASPLRSMQATASPLCHHVVSLRHSRFSCYVEHRSQRRGFVTCSGFTTANCRAWQTVQQE